jgi:hypothetical protein
MTTKQFIENNIGELHSFLGHGTFGEAWLLTDGSVVKITSAIFEKTCVERLFQIQEDDPKEYIKYFPLIYEYGDVNEIRWEEGFEIEYDPIFYYRRENIGDIPQMMRGKKSSKMIIEHETEVEGLFGIIVEDSHMDNYGFREGDWNHIILRDLMCYIS